MATPAEIQAFLDNNTTIARAQITQSAYPDATYSDHYVVGISDIVAGRSRWCRTTSADGAEVQANSILAQLRE